MLWEKDKLVKALEIDGLEELIQLYKDYDIQTSFVRRDNNFFCVSGCGACCYKPSLHLEVTVFEMIPLAIDLIISGQGNYALEILNQQGIEQMPCVMYHKTSEDGSQGYCTNYDNRPLICRYFGGAAKVGKYGSRQLVLCKILKEKHKLNQDLLDHLSNLMPFIPHVTPQLRNLNRYIDNGLYPLNQGLKQALEYVLFRMQWLDPDAPEPNDPPVLTPSGGVDIAA